MQAIPNTKLNLGAKLKCYGTVNSSDSAQSQQGIALRYITAYDYFRTYQSLGQREVRQKPDPEARISLEVNLLLPVIRSGLVHLRIVMTAVKHVIERTKIMSAT